MNLIKKKLFITLFLCSLSLVTFGQKDNLATQKILWRLRADTITNNLLKETTKTDELRKALLYSKLGNLWWKADSKQSNVWFEKSVDVLFFYSTNGEKSKKEEFFQAARKILVNLSNYNQDQSNRLVKILSEVDKEYEKDKSANSDALIDYALQIVKENPNKATQVGIIALRTGYPKSFYKLIWELRRNNISLADQLFTEAFTLAKNSPDFNLLQGIQLAALPESHIADFPKNLDASSQQKIEVLNFFADYIVQLQAQTKFSAKPTSCSNEALVILRSKNQFDTLLPQKAALVYQAVDLCLGKKAQTIFEVVEKSSEILSVNELLDLAEKNKNDHLLRVAYLMKAVALSDQQKNYVLLIKIIDDLSKEDMQDDPDFWKQMRYEAAGLLAYLQYKDKDIQSALKTLKDTPSPLRPFAQTVFGTQFLLNNDPNYNFLTPLLDDARNGFIKSEEPFTKKSDYWFQLIKIYSNYKLQGEAAAVFKEIINVYNNAPADDENNHGQINSAKISAVFSDSLLETQANAVFDTTQSINEPESRTNANFAFLKITLQKYERLNSQVEKTLVKQQK